MDKYKSARPPRVIRDWGDVCASFGQPRNTPEYVLDHLLYKFTEWGCWVRQTPEGVIFGRLRDEGESKDEVLKYPFRAKHIDLAFGRLERSWKRWKKSQDPHPAGKTVTDPRILLLRRLRKALYVDPDGLWRLRGDVAETPDVGKDVRRAVHLLRDKAGTVSSLSRTLNWIRDKVKAVQDLPDAPLDGQPDHQEANAKKVAAKLALFDDLAILFNRQFDRKGRKEHA